MAFSNFSFTPLKKIHLYSSDVSSDFSIKQDIQYLRIFSGVAILVLLLAVINYINLAVVKSLKKAKQIGIQKILGASRAFLMKRYLFESMLYCLMAVLIALVLIEMVLSDFNYLANTNVGIRYSDFYFLSFISAVGLGVAILSGAYPAFYLSSRKALETIKNGLNPRRLKIFESGMVSFQFLIVQGLVIVSIVIFSQLNYVNNKDLGLNDDNLLVVSLNGEISFAEAEILKNELLTNASVSSVTAATPVPGAQNYNNRLTGKDLSGYEGEPDDSFLLNYYAADFDFVNTFGMEVVAGRWYAKNIASDPKEAIVINQTAANQFGWSDDAVGQSIKVGENKLVVIGVVGDFHTQSFHQTIQPAMFALDEKRAPTHLALRFQTDETQSLIHGLENIWKENNLALEYYFMDDYYTSFYESENRLKTLLAFFSIVAIIIAIMGVFGLTSFTIQMRIKEFGIRKVLGASLFNIIFMLTKEVNRLVVLGFVLALPLSYYFLQLWLSSFVYRVELSSWSFILVFIATNLMVWLTLSVISFKSANKNPIVDLRYE